MTFIFSVGKYGGFYFYNGYSKRLCLGWFAFTIIPKDVDVIFGKYREKPKSTSTK